MRAAGRAAWVDFSTPLEGCVPRFYADDLGLVSTGIGNLLDAPDPKTGKPLPIDEAWRLVRHIVLALPWTSSAGIVAGPSQVETAWRAVRSDPKCATKGWKYAVGIPANNVRLSLEAVEKLVLEKLDTNDAILAARFKDWENRPVDAQMAVHSMAWAMGAYFPRKFPRFSASFDKGDYAAAAGECAIANARGTVTTRNQLNRRLLLAAARPGADPAVLSWSRPS